MNFLQRCIQPADCSRTHDHGDSEDDEIDVFLDVPSSSSEDEVEQEFGYQLARCMTQDLTGDFLKIRREVEQRVRYMLSKNLNAEDHLSCFADIIKMMSMCGDFGEGHIMFLDTLWIRSREIIHARRRSEQHLKCDAQTIRLDFETEALYQEMRQELMALVADRSSHRNISSSQSSMSQLYSDEINPSGTSQTILNGAKTKLSCELKLDAT